MPAWLAATETGVRISVRVQPRASRTEVAGPHGDDLRVRLASPPVDGAANRELVTFLAKKLGRPRSALTLLRGQRGRRKTIEVNNIEPDDVTGALWPGEGRG